MTTPKILAFSGSLREGSFNHKLVSVASKHAEAAGAEVRLAEAQIAEIRALVDYQVAQVDLAFATGTLLGASRVRWEAEDPRGPDDQFGDRLHDPNIPDLPAG